MAKSKLLVPGAAQVLNQFKEEIAAEFGVVLGGEASARDNGSVGGEITKRLIAMSKNQF